MENVQIINYSEKAFAVIGETKAIKDSLKQMGGNRFLKVGPGWIFSKKRLANLEQALGTKMQEMPAEKFVSEGNSFEPAEPDVAAMIQANEEAYYDNFVAQEYYPN